MTDLKPARGGSPVGYLSELDPIEAGAVQYLRLWCDGPDAQVQIHQEFSELLGPEAGSRAIEEFAHLCRLCASHGRRPLLRHGVGCKCLGGDEACFANFIAYATEGEREDALLLAATLVRPQMAPAVVDLAQQFGLTLKRITLNERRLRGHSARFETPKTLH